MKIEEIIEVLKQRKYLITTVESCTGGLVAASIVDVNGASSVFEKGYVTYSDNAKEQMVGVSSNIIEEYGVVSTQVAEEMVQCGMQVANADCGIATTGIAGPTGGTKECPVGTVCIAVGVKNRIVSKKYIFNGNRTSVRHQAVEKAFEMLSEVLLYE